LLWDADLKSGLVKEPFPNLNNPLHRKIWMDLWKKGRIANGFGSICDYYGFFLIAIDSSPICEPLFSFYDPTNRFVLPANERMALDFYGGDKEATVTNAISVVRHLLALNRFETLIVSDAEDIPHATFIKDNPALSFKDWLSSKGIVIRPATLVRKNENADHTAYGECTLFVYQPCGGMLFRYEIRSWHGRISDIQRFSIGNDIGDLWYLID